MSSSSDNAIQSKFGCCFKQSIYYHVVL